MQIANPIIPIPELKERQRNDLEKLLSVFDQNNITDNNHILNVNEKDFPVKYRDLIRRLQKAASEPEIRKKMDAEDEIIDALAELERQKEEELAQKDKIIAEKEKTIKDSKKAIEDKNKAIEDKNKTIENKDKLIEELQRKLKERK